MKAIAANVIMTLMQMFISIGKLLELQERRWRAGVCFPLSLVSFQRLNRLIHQPLHLATAAAPLEERAADDFF